MLNIKHLSGSSPDNMMLAVAWWHSKFKKPEVQQCNNATIENSEMKNG